MGLQNDTSTATRKRYIRKQASKPPKKYSPPANFHTESQNAAANARTQYKLRRATKPLRSETRTQQQKAGPEGTAVRRNNQAKAQRDYRSHIRQVLRQHDNSPKDMRVAHKLIANEVRSIFDQERLRRTALDRSLHPSKRLAAARQLRDKYNVPTTTAGLLTPDRLKNVNKFLKETDRAIARDNKPGAGGITPLAAATADFNPAHLQKFVHTIGNLSTAGVDTVYKGLFGKKGFGGGHLGSPGKVIGNTLKDALDLPAQSVVSAVDIANVAKELGLHGNTKPAKELAKGTLELLKHPDQHPLAAALVLRGSVKGADAAAGTALRAAGKSKRVRLGTAHDLKTGKSHQMLDLRDTAAGKFATDYPGLRGKIGKFASTGGRKPVELYGKHKVERRYSSGVVGKRVQVALDKYQPGHKLYNLTNRQVRDAKQELKTARARGDKDQIRDAEQAVENAKIKPNAALPLLQEHYLKKRTDAAVEIAHASARMRLSAERKALRASVPKKLQSALRPIIEGTIKSPKTMVEDIRSELARLKDEEKVMRDAGEKSWRIRKNVRQQHVFENLLENKSFLEDPKPVFAAADRFIETQRQLEAKLGEHGLLDSERALRSKLIPFAAREMGARFDQATDRIVGPDGNPLSNAAILAEMESRGVRFDAKGAKLGFVSQRGDLGKLGDFYRNPTRQPAGYFKKRTGESARMGLHDLSMKAVDAQLSHTLSVLAQAEHATKILDQFGLKPKGDIAFTDRAHAESVANEMSAKNPHLEWTVVDVSPAVGDQIRAIHEHIDPASIELADTIMPGQPKYFVMPKTVAARFQEHTRALGSTVFHLSWQALTHQFRNTVLPLSARWLFGNVAELGVRGGIARTGPISWFVGHNVMNRLHALDPDAYEEFMGHAVSGAHYASQIRYDTYQGIERWNGHGFATFIGRQIGGALRLPPLQQARWLYHHWAQAVKWITPRIEQEFQKAAIGKRALAELRDFNGSWLKAIPHWDAALDDVTRGLTDTNKQIQFAQYVDDVVGRYNKLSPGVRTFVSGYAPFALWYANALRFVFAVLPRDHPVVTGLLAAGYANTEKERLENEESLTRGKKHLPDFLQGTIVQKGGSHLPLQRYTPFGAFSDPESIQGLFLPQIGSMSLAIAGKNWMLEDLKVPEGTDAQALDKRLEIGLYATLEATIPGLSIGRRFLEKGGSAYDNSTIVSPKTRPDSQKGYLEALNKIGNPLRAYAPGGSSAPGNPTPGRSGSGSSSNRFLDQASTDTQPTAPKNNRFLSG